MISSKRILFSLCLLSITSQSSFADTNTLTIKDCDNKIRLSENINEDSVSVVAKVEKTSSVSTVSMKKSDSDTKLTNTINNNQVTIGNVTSGTWTICSDNFDPQQNNNKVVFQEIKVIKENLSTASIAGVSIAAAGALGIVLGNSDSNNTETRVVETTPQVTEPITTDNIQEVVSDATNSVNNPKEKCKDKNVAGARASGPCFIGEDDDVTPISPFS